MKYFFILGNNPTLSMAELAAVFAEVVNWQLVSSQVCIVDLPKEIDAQKLIRRLGGTIKIGIIRDELKGKDLQKIKDSVLNILGDMGVESKFHFDFTKVITD